MGTDILSAPWATPALRKAVEELRRLEGNEQMRDLYKARLDQVRVLATELESSFEEGRDEARGEMLGVCSPRVSRRGRSEHHRVEPGGNPNALSVEAREGLPGVAWLGQLLRPHRVPGLWRSWTAGC